MRFAVVDIEVTHTTPKYAEATVTVWDNLMNCHESLHCTGTKMANGGLEVRVLETTEQVMEAIHEDLGEIRDELLEAMSYTRDCHREMN